MASTTIEPSEFSYNLVIQAIARRGDAARAAQWMTEALTKGIAGNPGSYSGIVHAYLKAHLVDEADSWLSHMASAGVPMPAPSHPASPESLAAAWEQRGNVQRAAAVRKLGDRAVARSEGKGA